MKTTTRVLQLLLGLAFLGAGGQKLAGTDQMVDDFDRYPQWFRVVMGTVEVTGALGMLAGLYRPALVPAAGLLLSATMLGALTTHVRLKDPVSKMVPPAALLTLSAAVLATLLAGSGRVPESPK